MADTLDAQHPSLARRLVAVFAVWKVLLFLLTAFCPGPGYDTSALILYQSGPRRHAEFQSASRVDHLTLNLFRWDALYFVGAAQRGYVYEQEWAFSWAHSSLLRALTEYVFEHESIALRHYIWAGIAVSTACHLLSVLVLFRLLNEILGRKQNGRVPFIASVLHIMSPASLFLASPYSEALFSALNFTGMLHYVLARKAESKSARNIRQVGYMLSSGMLFALATLIRSNGLLSGLVFLYDVASLLPRILALQLSRHEVRRILLTCIAGCLIAAGFVGPQYMAYKEYCVTNSPGPEVRVWCAQTIPSIYTWVQSHYWNVGFLRYWTLSNLPLFLLAIPMLWLLLVSGVTFLRNSSKQPSAKSDVSQKSGNADLEATDPVPYGLPQLALPQIVLAITAFTSFHVQVINRISSGYPIWYLIVARWVAENDKRGNVGVQWATRGIIIYAIVQGMLFANFLPPA